MSSSYYILCLSHDPAIQLADYNRPELAVEAVAAGVDGHPHCDLAIGRYSYPLVEVGCPASRDQPAKLRCCHSGPKWVDTDWLRLLAAGYQTTDPLVEATVKRVSALCWPWRRLQRLHVELGIDLRTPQPDREKCPRCSHPTHREFCGITKGIEQCACTGDTIPA